MKTFSPTNHDRLQTENKIQLIGMDKNSNSSKLKNDISSTASVAHLHITDSNPDTIASTNMPPPANVGLIPTMSQTTPQSVLCVKNPHVSPQTLSTLSIASSIPTLSTSIANTVLKNIEATAPTTNNRPQVIYRSYFERDDDALSDEFRCVAE